MDPFTWFGFTPEDIILLDLVLTSLWISFSIIGACFLLYQSRRVNQFDLIALGEEHINVHVHAGIRTVKQYNISPNQVSIQNFENSICFKYNSQTNSTIVQLNLSHPITGLFLGAFASYYSRILPFILSLLLIGQNISWKLNLTTPVTQVNNIMNGKLGIILRNVFIVLDAPFSSEQPTVQPMPIPNIVMSSLVNLINSTPVQIPNLPESAPVA